MITIAFRFPGGRYHATPWGHHVNEGLVEWPPSPWRLVRSMLAVGFSTLGWSDIPAVGRRLIETLVSVPPRYQLPTATTGHSRHYMPTAQLEGGREKTTLVVDSWAHVGRDAELWVRWDVTLDPECGELFANIVRSWGYLGRSESWVECRMVDESEPWSMRDEVAPSANRPAPGPRWQQVSLLCPVPAPVYADWAATQRPPLLTSEKPRGARSKKDGVDPYPTDLIQCLQLDQAWLYDQGWSQPPGSQQVLYWVPADRLEIGAPPMTAKTTDAEPVVAVLLAMAYPGGNTHALPQITRTLPQGELLHRRLVGTAVRLGFGPLSMLTGTNDNKERLAWGHQHAHVLHVDLDGDGHLDHVLVWAPAGLDGECQQTLRAVRKTVAKNVGDLDLAWVGAGSLDDLRRLPGVLGDNLGRVLGPPGGAKDWESVTPFVPPRFLKKQGKNGLWGQVCGECESRGLPIPESMEVIDFHSEQAAPLRHHIRVRRNGAPPPVDAGFVLRLHFGTPIVGPLTLGYGSHFGLGLFRVAEGAG